MAVHRTSGSKGHRSGVPRLLLVPLLVATPLAAADRAAPTPPSVIGEHRRDTVLETPHPYPAASSKEKELVWSDHYAFPGAKYLVFEFQKFDLAPGDRVEVRDPDGEQVQVFRGQGFLGKGGNFVTKMILGAEAHIDLYSANPGHEHYGYRIERITRGYSDSELAVSGGGTESICGIDDAADAICYQTTFPDVYDRSRAVARIVMDGAALCTAWIVSCENHLITANHCTWNDFNFDSQDELDRMEFQFMYQDATCGGSDPSFDYSFMGGTWLENDHDLDYTLIQAPAGEEPASTYGWLPVDYRPPAVDELVYIVGHPDARPKEISLYSSDPSDQDNPDGFCEVYSTNEPACIGGTASEIGYQCDTEGAGSGSPVLSRDTNRVVALHHCPNCPNRGVRIQNIWDHNQAGAHPLPPCSLFAEAGSIELDRGSYACSDSISIRVIDASILGAGSEMVTLWSSRESSPETVSLVETPSGSGVFVGTLDTTVAAPTGGDGLLSVSDGGTMTARYIDADDGDGGTNIPREAIATADCSGPVISGVRAEDVLGSAATIAWSTDEPADAEVFYSAAPPSWSSVADMAPMSTHALQIAALGECTAYLYRVESTDESGNRSVDDNGGLYHGFTTGADVVEARVSTDTPLTIFDNTNAYSVITVPQGGPVVDVNVTLSIDHTYAGDLEAYLRGPNGVEIDLSSDNGGAGDDYGGTVFDDEATTSIRSGAAPFTGSFRPEQPLSAFDGIDAAGDWILRVFDDEGGDMGTLESWGLTLLLPAKTCGPSVSYYSHAAEADDCSLGGPGDLDGSWDAGEEIDFSILVENDGTELLTAVQATLTPLTAGVTVLSGTRSYGTLPADATGGPVSPFSIHLPDNAGCGDLARFRLDISAAEGAWSDLFSQILGEILPSGGTVLDENFDLVGIPASWTTVDGGQSSDSWFADNAADPGGCASTNPNLPMSGNWAAVDSDCAGEVNMDESLVTPLLDLGSALTVTLEFDHYFNRDATETTEVDVRSSLTNGNWVTVGAWTADTANPAHETIDITAQAAGANDVEIRWHYDKANFAWYWYVDNVVVGFDAAGGCEMSTCATGSPPGEQTGAHWTGPDTFAWSQDPEATSGYTIYCGATADLPALESPDPDSCVRFAAAGSNVIDLSADDPQPGLAHWYLVTGSNAVGEGSPGSGSGGFRIVNEGGPCPP